MKKILLISLCFCALFALQHAFGMEKYSRLIPYEQVKGWIDSKKDFLLVDSLSPIEFDAGSIPGAVNIPMGLVEKSNLMPTDKSKPIVFFCKGTKCHKSHESARIAEKMGCKDVWVYDGGSPDWASHGHPLQSKVSYKDVKVPTITPKDLKTKMDAGEKFLLLDIQDDPAYKDLHIQGVKHICIEEIHTRFSELSKDENIVVICKAGMQNLIASQFLTKNGYTKIQRLDEGTQGWAKAGYPTEK